MSALRTERWLAECVAAGFETLSVSITIDPDIRGGVPVMKGTRFTVAQALAELAETSGVTEFAEEFDIDPTVVRNMLGGLSLILHAAELVPARKIHVERPWWTVPDADLIRLAHEARDEIRANWR